MLSLFCSEIQKKLDFLFAMTILGVQENWTGEVLDTLIHFHLLGTDAAPL